MPKLQTFDGPELDVVLARVRKEAGADAKITSATKVRSGGIGGFFSKENFRVTVEMPDPVAAPAPEPAATVPFASMFDALTPPPMSIFELADMVDEAEVDAVAVTAPPPAPAPVFVPTERPPAHVPSTEKPSFNAVLRRIASEAGAPTAAPAPQHAIERPAPPAIERRVPKELLALGLPESMLPADMSPGMAVAALLRSLDLPAAAPLPYKPGNVTVVVGERRAAARLAQDVARELHLAKSDVWIAEPGPEGRPNRLVSAADAAIERQSWIDGPSVIALTAPPGTADQRWADSMLDALEPSAVWGVVSADRKTEDIAAWADGLGGLDALALEHLDRTVSPASVLQLGIPVARIEGQVATPALWAVLLAERIAA